MKVTKDLKNKGLRRLQRGTFIKFMKCVMVHLRRRSAGRGGPSLFSVHTLAGTRAGHLLDPHTLLQTRTHGISRITANQA